MDDVRPFTSTVVSGAPDLDRGPGRYRLGLIVLATDQATERDFINMRPSDQVGIHTSRVLNTNPVTVENLRAMGPKLTEAASLLVPGSELDAVAYSCTSGAVAIGDTAVRESIQAARPGIPVITPLAATVAGCRTLGVRRLAVLTPYLDTVNAPIRDYLVDRGLDIPAFTSFRMADDNDMARLTPETIRRAALEAARPDADALFVSCTAIRAAEVAERLEEELGKPVLTSIQALFWGSLRSAGFMAPVKGWGRLLKS